MNAMPRLPVTVIGGYLGAGKTTLVNSLLRQAQGRRLAVLVNDFGDLSIDADLIEGGDEDMLQLAGGCVCCTIGSDLVATLGELRERFSDIDHVLLEASGVALPGSVAATIGLFPGLRRAAVVVLVSGERLPGLLADGYLADTIERQVAAADLLLISHAAELDEPALSRVGERLRAINDKATQLRAEQGDVPIEIVLEPDVLRAAGANDSPTHLASGQADATNARASDDESSGQRPTKLRARSLRPAAKRFTSLTLTGPDGVDPSALAKALSAPALGIERAKGLLRDGSGRLHVVHALGSRCLHEPLDRDTADGLGRLVVIGLSERLDRRALQSALPEFRITAERNL
ncbi:MAG: GTP-binding protein [Burkholderiaceae bacterium]